LRLVSREFGSFAVNSFSARCLENLGLLAALLLLLEVVVDHVTIVDVENWGDYGRLKQEAQCAE
jgi:hypothetical protein